MSPAYAGLIFAACFSDTVGISKCVPDLLDNK